MPRGRGLFFVTTALSVAALFTMIFWLTSGVGVGQPAANPGEAGVASLIQQRTARFAQQNSEIEAALEQANGGNKEVVGVLHTGSEYRRSAVTVLLDRVEFYSSETIISYRVTNNSSESVELDPGDAHIEQTVSGSGSTIKLQQQGADQILTINPGEARDISSVFVPFNGREPFTFWTGTFRPTGGQEDPWEARFEVSAAQITS